jgi:hypothetical protein
MADEESVETRLLNGKDDVMRQETASGQISSRKGTWNGTGDASSLLVSDRTLVDLAGQDKSSSFEDVDFGCGSVAQDGISGRPSAFRFWKWDGVRLSSLVRSAALLLLGGALGFLLAHKSGIFDCLERVFEVIV